MHSFIFGEVSSRMVFDYKIFLNKRRVLIVCLFFFLFGHALLISTISSESKNQQKKQKFKHILRSTYQMSSERSVLDLKSEVWGFNTQWGNMLLLEYFVFM